MARMNAVDDKSAWELYYAKSDTRADQARYYVAQNGQIDMRSQHTV